MVVKVSAAGGVDVAGGTGGQLHTGDSGRDPDSHLHLGGRVPGAGIGQLYTRGGGHVFGGGCRSGHVPEPDVFLKPAIGNFQPDPGSAAGWLRRSGIAAAGNWRAAGPAMAPFHSRIHLPRADARMARLRSDVRPSVRSLIAGALPRADLRTLSTPSPPACPSIRPLSKRSVSGALGDDPQVKLVREVVVGVGFDVKFFVRLP